MMNRKWSHHPSHGFRFSLTDAIAILVCVTATVWGLSAIGAIAWIFPFVLGHFFLFCNVFRVPRKPELVWAASLIVIAAACLIADAPIVVAMCMVLQVTVGVIVYAVRLPTYHGICSAKRSSDSIRSD